MSKPTTRLVTQNRLKELLECYGSSSSFWPAEERQAALNLLNGSPELITQQSQIQSLDKLLMEYRNLESNSIDQRAVQSLQQRIMSQLPEQELPESNTDDIDRPTLYPYRFRFLAGSIAASILVASLSLGVIHQLYPPENNPTIQPSAEIASNAFSQWAWEDITGESIEPESENDPTTLYALVALEFPAE